MMSKVQRISRIQKVINNLQKQNNQEQNNKNSSFNNLESMLIEEKRKSEENCRNNEEDLRTRMDIREIYKVEAQKSMITRDKIISQFDKIEDIQYDER